MALSVGTVFLVAAILCFVLATAGIASRLNWQSLGLVFLALAFLFPPPRM